MRISKRLPWILALLLAGGGGAHFGLRYWADSQERRMAEELSPDEAWPAGRWHRSREAGQTSGEEEARLLSLPYTAGRQIATRRSGVVYHDPETAWAGLNLYCSGHAAEALLVDMDGEVLHRWRMPFERAFPDRAPTVDSAFWRRVHLLPDGGLLALYQGGGLIALDRRSRLLWTSASPVYNDLFVDPEGQIWTIAKVARRSPELDPQRPVLEDFVLVLGPDGEERARHSLFEAFRDSPLAPVLQPMASWGDVFHTNTIERLDGRFAARAPLYRRGNVLVSLREVDIVAVFDPDARTIVWARRGPWQGQHQPTVLADGAILLFDNQGAAGHSRVLEFDPLAEGIRWQWGGTPEQPLSSPEAGSCQRLPNGNTLVTESERGRAFELTPDGLVAWEFLSPHRTGRDDELVATLFEVVRLPRDAFAEEPPLP